MQSVLLIFKRAELKPDGYDLKDNPRPYGRIGSGISILFKTGIRCKVLSSGELMPCHAVPLNVPALLSRTPPIVN